MNELEKIWCKPKEDGWPTEYGYWYPEGAGGGNPYIREDVHKEKLKEAYERGVRDATDSILLLQQYFPQGVRGDAQMFLEDQGGWIDVDEVEAVLASLLDKKEESDG